MLRSCCVGAAMLVVGFAASGEVRAADLSASGKILVTGGPLQLVCDDSRTYPIRPRAVTEFGELVTGYIQTAPRRHHHFRLFPMGNGYRYGGHGFWFDGIRGEAVLFLGPRPANCSVEYL